MAVTENCEKNVGTSNELKQKVNLELQDEGQSKGRTGGRTPLGDLSNARKPINQAGENKALDGSLKSGKSSASQASNKQLKSESLIVIMNDEAVNAKAKKYGK
ncbi:unnamed protein product [Lupinus luteus]|uniref:Uncharacterized protein n=1 Tax=Lupinus luteus TaxID=3873 RepID=A0AAV1Y369_LUPLU